MEINREGNVQCYRCGRMIGVKEATYLFLDTVGMGEGIELYCPDCLPPDHIVIPTVKEEQSE